MVDARRIAFIKENCSTKEIPASIQQGVGHGPTDSPIYDTVNSDCDNCQPSKKLKTSDCQRDCDNSSCGESISSGDISSSCSSGKWAQEFSVRPPEEKSHNNKEGLNKLKEEIMDLLFKKLLETENRKELSCGRMWNSGGK